MMALCHAWYDRQPSATLLGVSVVWVALHCHSKPSSSHPLPQLLQQTINIKRFLYILKSLVLRFLLRVVISAGAVRSHVCIHRCAVAFSVPSILDRSFLKGIQCQRESDFNQEHPQTVHWLACKRARLSCVMPSLSRPTRWCLCRLWYFTAACKSGGSRTNLNF